MAKVKKTPQQIADKLKDNEKRSHVGLVRSLFRLAGFSRLADLTNFVYDYNSAQSDFDDVFIYENIIVIAEYTTSNEAHVSDHLKKKKICFDIIAAGGANFIKYMKSSSADFEGIAAIYKPAHYKVVQIYCSKANLSAATKALVPVAKFLDYHLVKYFHSVGKAVRESSRFEILDFLGIEAKGVGAAAITTSSLHSDTYSGSILPEDYSNFGPGFKVVSFYVEPEALLERAYVLRRDRWRGGAGSYQRMLSATKIKSIRKYLAEKERVFINNIIVTLPSDTKLLDDEDNTISISSVTQTIPGRIQLKKRFNSVGIVDGQHRLFAYHEGGDNLEKKIAELRKTQNLLVTGIVFPKTIKDIEAMRFQANLFLEINTTQATAKSDLKQEIEVILRPYARDSIARRVVNRLNDERGPLQDHFEKYFFDKKKLKVTSVVVYGVRPLVKLGGSGSLFDVWSNPNKDALLLENDDGVLEDYIKFCAQKINHIIAAAKSHIPKDRWTSDQKVKGRFLTTTNVNGLIALVRKLTAENEIGQVADYISAMKGLESFNFSTFKSSHYNDLGLKLYDKYFA